MSPTLATFLFQVINVLLLAAALTWLFFKPVRAALQARQDAERQHREELTAREAAIEAQRADVEQRLRSLDAEMAALRQRHLAAATQEAAAIQGQAQDAAQRERESARRALTQLERAQLERLATAVAAATRELVARLLTTLAGRDLDESLLRAACDQLRKMDTSRMGSVLVETASALEDGARRNLLTALDRLATSTQFLVVPALGAGVRIVTPSGLIDASATGMAREAEQVLSDTLSLEVKEAKA